MFLEEFLVILKSISIIKAPKILPKIKRSEAFLSCWANILKFCKLYYVHGNKKTCKHKHSQFCKLYHIKLSKKLWES